MDLFKSYGPKTLILSAINSVRAPLESHQQVVDINGADGVIWPLFFRKEAKGPAAYELDTCATSLGFSATQRAMAFANIDFRSVANKTLVTLIELRRDDGSWPSVQLAPGAGNAPATEGIVNDTVYALNAMLDAGFLEKEASPSRPSFPEHFQNLQSLAARIEWLAPSIHWLRDNKLERGWFFTSTEFMADKSQFAPVTAATAAIVVLLDRLILSVRDEEACTYTGLMESMKIGALSWLQDSQHETGGFGSDIQDVPRMAHTALAISALLTSDKANSKLGVIRALDWLQMKVKKKGLEYLQEADTFDEYSQAIFIVNNVFRKRLIAHEYAVEAIVLSAFCQSYESRAKLSIGLGKSGQLSKLIIRTAKNLISRQIKDGPYRGAFLSRRNIPNERHPIYWAYFSVVALLNAYKLIDSGAISGLKNFINSFIFRSVFVVLASAMYIYFEGWKFKELIILLITGVAVNIASIYFTREHIS